MTVSLKWLLDGIAAIPDSDAQIVDLAIDSRDVRAGSLFLALSGTKSHGLEHAADAAARGASAVLWEPAAGIQPPSFAGQLDREKTIKRLREVLDQLSPKCRAAVVLQYWHGLTYEEIGQRLGVSANMVKKYLSQAIVHCRRRMARLG